jgi:hypothetical protein
VVVFHSSAETMLEFQGELPFAAIADPDKKLYAEFGVESSLKAVLNPRAPLAGFRARSVVHSVRGAMGIGEKHFGLPADFLIAPDGLVLAAKHGKHANDQWSVDELLDLAKPHSRPLPTADRSTRERPRADSGSVARPEPPRAPGKHDQVPTNDARQCRAGRRASRPLESCRVARPSGMVSSNTANRAATCPRGHRASGPVTPTPTRRGL